MMRRAQRVPLLVGRLTLLLLLCVTTGSTATPPGAAAAPPTARFGVPVLLGMSNASKPGGSRFWFPSLSVPTGIPGHVAQHITLSGDGGNCPLPGQDTACDQIMLTRDGGRSYTLVKKLAKPAYSPKLYVPTSGNFNGYGDLGTWVPASNSSLVKPTPGHFVTIVGCNDCLGGSFRYPTYLQTWVETETGLRLTKNVTVSYSGTPAGFASDSGCRGSYAPPPPSGHPSPPGGNTECGLRTPSQTIIRTACRR